VGCLTSDTVWNLRVLPARLVVLGGGPIGCELAQAFARLGSKVTQVEMLPRILVREDPEVSAMVTQRFREDGIDVLAGHKAAPRRRRRREFLVVAARAARSASPSISSACAAARARAEELGIR
jgi:pyruvate/2-oxoglutarate dehydrogenase complex dihydrolipoamide dehydrogenase (E3) component